MRDDGKESIMAQVVVFGAGMIARPLIEYFVQRKFSVTVASREFTAVIDSLLQTSPNAQKVVIDVQDQAAVNRLVASADVVVSLLPYTIHVKIVNACLKLKKHLVTTSYLQDDIKRFHEEAEANDITILMETGMDPGIDHMSARQVIDEVHQAGGEVETFHSYCGGLPAPDSATNPWKYKFSWSPKGVLLAARHSARYLNNGKIVEVPAERLFEQTQPIRIDSYALEVYPNRDALPYRNKYDIPEAHTIFRGTLRYPGWSVTMETIRELGFLEDREMQLGERESYHDVTGKILDIPSGNGAREMVSTHLSRNGKLSHKDAILQRLEWIGLFSDDRFIETRTTPIDFLNYLMLKKMQYHPGEEDMILMRHEFDVRYNDRRERIVLTLNCFGHPGENGATAQCVSYPAAVAARLILEGKITRRGTIIPVDREIYQPVLEELTRMDISFKRQQERLD